MIQSAPQTIDAPGGQYSSGRGRLTSAVLAAGIFLIILTGVGRDFGHSLEVSFASSVNEGVRDHDFFLPRLDGRLRFIKPPLPLILVELAARAFEHDHASLVLQRICLAVVAGLLTLVVCALARDVFEDTATEFWAGLVFISCMASGQEMRLVRHDAFLALGVAVTMLGCWRTLHRRRFGWVWLTLGLLLAMQSKGPVSWLLSLIPATVFALWSARGLDTKNVGSARRRRRLVMAWWGLGALSAAPLLLWAIYVQSQTTVNLWEDYKWEVIGRFASKKVPLDSPAYYLQYLGYLAPWSVLLVGGVVMCFPASERERQVARRARFFLVWLGIGLLLLSLPKEKTHRYAIPLLAPGAVLAGWAVSALVRRARDSLDRTELKWLFGSHVVLLAVFSVAVPVVLVKKDCISVRLAISLSSFLLLLVGIALLFLKKCRLRSAFLTTSLIGIVTQLVLIAASDQDPRAETFRATASAIAPIVGRHPIFSWPESRPPYALAYYLNRTIERITDPLVIVEQNPGLQYSQVLAQRNDPVQSVAQLGAALTRRLARINEPTFVLTNESDCNVLLSALSERRFTALERARFNASPRIPDRTPKWILYELKKLE